MPTTPLPEIVLLDALGTLVALESPAPRLRAGLAERFEIVVSDEEAGAALAAEIAYYRAHLDEGRDPPTLLGLRRRCAEVLRRALPRSAQLEAVPIAALTEALVDALRFTAYADAPPALAALGAAGHRLVVVSNWDASLPEVLAGLELTPLLDGVISSAACGARKPAPEIFHRALALVAAGPEAAVHVGDSLQEDVAGARAAGITPVLIARAGSAAKSEEARSAEPGVRVISSLLELTPGT